MKGMKDLYRIACHDVLVHAAMTAWQHGDFPSFEAALIHLVCTQAEENERLREDARRAFQADLTRGLVDATANPAAYRKP